MEPDEDLLNLSEKGRVEMANEVQPQHRAGPGPGRAGQPGAEGTHNSPGSGTMFFPHVCGFYFHSILQRRLSRE